MAKLRFNLFNNNGPGWNDDFKKSPESRLLGKGGRLGGALLHPSPRSTTFNTEVWGHFLMTFLFICNRVSGPQYADWRCPLSLQERQPKIFLLPPPFQGCLHKGWRRRWLQCIQRERGQGQQRPPKLRGEYAFCASGLVHSHLGQKPSKTSLAIFTHPNSPLGSLHWVPSSPPEGAVQLACKSFFQPFSLFLSLSTGGPFLSSNIFTAFLPLTSSTSQWHST